MRRIVMFNRLTADGSFAGPDGSLDWIVPEPEFDRSAAKAIDRGGVDLLLFGRRTYELFARFWPHALHQSPDAADPHQAGRRSPEMRAMAKMLNETMKLVYSTTLTAATWQNSHVIRALDWREVEALKLQRGQDIMIFGSGTIVSQLTAHGLIDEYRFLVAPVLLGGGLPLMAGATHLRQLTLLDATTYPSGSVLLRYSY
jgi:dihydrofolate reductase